MSEQNSEPRPFDPPVPPTAPPGAPTEPPAAPPAPPAPPAPEVPARPQYGEYAPAGYVPPSAPLAPGNPYGIPGYAAPATPSNSYGIPNAAVPAQAPAPAYAPLGRKRRTWDTVLTSILLVLALFGTVIALLYAWIFSNPSLLAETMTSAGYGGFTGSVGAASTILAVSHIGLFIVTAAVSILLLVRGRIVVFWVPLAAGFIAAIVFWAVVFSVISSDPSFLQNSPSLGG